MNLTQLENYFRSWQTNDEGHAPGIRKGISQRDKYGVPLIGTPFASVRDFINAIPNEVLTDSASTYGIDIPEAAHILILEKNIDPKQIWIDADSQWKKDVAYSYGINYNSDINNLRRDISWNDQTDEEMKRQFTVNLINYKFTENTGNKSESKSLPRIRNGLSYVQNNGYFGVIGTSIGLLLPGQKSGFNEIAENQIIKAFSKIDFPGGLGVEASGILVKKTRNKKSIVKYVANNGKDIDLDINDFVYYRTNKRFIPSGITSQESLDLVKKIQKMNNDVFKFAASASRNSKMIGYFTSSKQIPTAPQRFGLNINGDSVDKYSGHGCALDGYSEENIRVVFQGKWFHWHLNQIYRRPVNSNPANLSYFPKLDLSTKWTFDKLAEKIGATDEEKQMVLDWAKEQNEDWQD